VTAEQGATAPEPGRAARAAWNDHWAGPDPYPASETQEETFERVWAMVADAAVDAWLTAAGGDGKPDEVTKRLLADVAEARGQLATTRAIAREVLAAYESGTVVSGELAGIWRDRLGGDHEAGEPEPVIIVFDSRESGLPWLEPLARAVRDMSGGRVIITDVDMDMSDCVIAVATREVDSPEAWAIWTGEGNEGDEEGGDHA